MISRPRVLVVCHSYAAADRVSVIAVVGIVNVPKRERTVWPRLAIVDALLFFCGRVSRGACSEWFVGTRGEHRHHTLHTTGLFIWLEAVVTVAVVCWTSQQRACLVGAWSWQPRDRNKRPRGTTVPSRGRTWVTMQVCRTKHGQRNLQFASVRSAVLSLWQARVAMSRVFRQGSLFSEPRFWKGFSR